MILGLICARVGNLPFAYCLPHSALSRNWSLSYQAAVWMYSTGDHQACDVTYRYEMSRSALPAGRPTDQW
jgi:hypothetical protein